MKIPARPALPIAFAALLAGCTHTVEPKVEPKVEVQVEMKMAVDVLSEPEKAIVSYKGKVLGETPQSLKVSTFEDVSSITVTSAPAGTQPRTPRSSASSSKTSVSASARSGARRIASRMPFQPRT